jgi:hypothetical protein
LGRVQGVFTSLVESLGVKDVQFEEIISLDVVSLQVLRYFFFGLLWGLALYRPITDTFC